MMVSETDENPVTSVIMAERLKHLDENNTEDIEIGIEFDDDGRVTRVAVYTSDKNTVDAIAVPINNMDKGESCTGCFVVIVKLMFVR